MDKPRAFLTTEAGAKPSATLTKDVGLKPLVKFWGLPEVELVAEPGSFSLIGHDATLTPVLLAPTLEAEPGSFTLTGHDAALLRALLLAADQGSFALTGHDAALLVGETLAAEAGAFAITGQDAALLHHRVLHAEAGTLTVTGQDAALLRHHVLVAESGAFTVTGHDATTDHVTDAYEANPVHFDGSNDWLGGDELDNISDANSITFSVWFRRSSTDTREWFFSNSGPQYAAGFTNETDVENNLWLRVRNSSNTRLLNWFVEAEITDEDWHHFMVSVLLSGSGTLLAYVDGVKQTATPETYQAGTGHFSRDTHAVGAATNGVNKFNGDMADLQIWFGQFVDLDQQANRELFIKDGKPVDPADASGTLGTPNILMTGATNDWHENKGTGGGYTENGALTDGSDPVEL